jgi:hypothetical protein
MTNFVKLSRRGRGFAHPSPHVPHGDVLVDPVQDILEESVVGTPEGVVESTPPQVGHTTQEPAEPTPAEPTPAEAPSLEVEDTSPSEPESVPSHEEAPAHPRPSKSALRGMNKADLLSLSATLGMSLDESLTKAEIITEIEKL